MAVELMLGYRTDALASNMEETAVKEAASGLESVEKLINLLSHSQNLDSASKSDVAPSPDYKAVADVAVSKFRRVISLLGRTRTGHARFRRGPVAPNPIPENPIHEEKIYYATPIQQIPPPRRDHPVSCTTTINFSPYGSSGQQGGSFLTGGEPEGKVVPLSGGFHITDLSRTQVTSSVGKPPLSSSASFKRKCSSDNLGSVKCLSAGNSSRCHCSSSKKSRKMKLKRVVRVPAISLKMADIPPDEYSWRKYGQKPIKGSPHPRGYYKCSSVRGCPARKHVERAVDDPAMLVVTYEGDHNHSMAVVTAADSANLILESS